MTCLVCLLHLLYEILDVEAQTQNAFAVVNVCCNLKYNKVNFVADYSADYCMIQMLLIFSLSRSERISFAKPFMRNMKINSPRFDP